MRGLRLALAVCALGVAPAHLPAAEAAQARPELRIGTGGSEGVVPLATERGHAALQASRLTSLGWAVERTPLGVRLEGPRGERVEVRDGTPFLRWDDGLLQLADEPYFDGGELHIPLQFVSDVLPAKLPDLYRFDGSAFRLTYDGPERAGVPAVPGEPARHPVAVAEAGPVVSRAPPPGRRVVIIDAGHGGEDPGTMSRSGVREKNVALGIATAMAASLRGRDDLDVLLIRTGDTLIPLWERGKMATDMKGERHGVFVSIHANSAPSRASSARGFETYFLSEARNEHEQRVAAIENAPLGVEVLPEAQGDLDFILRELKNLDQPHWSSLLAEMVQRELAEIHPGPDRGVKQAPLAVLTNAIMPAVLVEMGYLSHPDEAALLGRGDFQREAGEAIAAAVSRFLERYPPGAGGGAGGGS